MPAVNRSPVLDHGGQFNTYTFPTARMQQLHSPPYRLTNQNNISSGSVQSDRSGSGQSEGFSIESSSSGSYKKRLKTPQSGVYSPAVSVYTEFGAREKTSRPTSRSASRKESFKDILAELKAHQNWTHSNINPMNVLPPPQPHLLDTPQLKHVPSFHMEDLDYSHRPLSVSGSSDNRGNKSFSSDLTTHSSQPASMSTVTSHDYENVVILSQESGPIILPSDPSLNKAEEIVIQAPAFQDERELRDIPAETLFLHSQTETEQAVTQLPENDAAHESSDLEVIHSDFKSHNL